jgi:hypothetical protein
MSPIEPRPYVSASQLVAYAMCPRKYAFRYVYGLRARVPLDSSLLLGSAVHGARLAGSSRSEARGEVSVTVAAARGAPPRGPSWLSTVGSRPCAGRTCDTGVSRSEDGRNASSRLYLEFASAISPVAAVEEPFEVELVDDATGEVLGRPLRGFFDLVLEDGTGSSSSRPAPSGWSRARPRAPPPGRGLRLRLRNTLHGGPSVVEVHVLVKLKREPQDRDVPSRRARRARQRAGGSRAAGEIESAIARAELPAVKPSPLCLECEYAHACCAIHDGSPGRGATETGRSAPPARGP